MKQNNMRKSSLRTSTLRHGRHAMPRTDATLTEPSKKRKGFMPKRKDQRKALRWKAKEACSLAEWFLGDKWGVALDRRACYVECRHRRVTGDP